jgi:hypothetical protein
MNINIIYRSTKKQGDGSVAKLWLCFPLLLFLMLEPDIPANNCDSNQKKNRKAMSKINEKETTKKKKTVKNILLSQYISFNTNNI